MIPSTSQPTEEDPAERAVQQRLDALGLLPNERQNLEGAPWFAELSPALRADILARATVLRCPDGTALATRGQAADGWFAVADGAVRVGCQSPTGRQVTLTYLEPGSWFGDLGLLDGEPRSLDTTAHGPTALLTVAAEDFRELVDQHVELCKALLLLNHRRMRRMFSMLEDLNTRSLRARLARQLLMLSRSYGVDDPLGLRIGLSLAQEEIAQMLGASRQRVNQELKSLERAGILKVEPTRLIILARERLLEVADS